MRYVAYVTPECQKQAEKAGQGRHLKNHAEKVEGRQSTQNWDRFYPSPYIKLSYSYWRIIASEHMIEETVVVCFLAFLKKSSREYEKKFRVDPAAFADPLVPNISEIRRYAKSRTDIPVDSLPKPSTGEYEFLHSGQVSLQPENPDGVVFESPEWVENIGKDACQNFLTRYFDLLSEAEGSVRPREIKEIRCPTSGAGVVIAGLPRKGSLLLIAPLLPAGGGEFDGEDTMSRWKEVFSEPDDDAVTQSCLRSSRRAYPSLALADEGVWRAIETNSEGNLALSPEETAVLDSVTGGQTGDEGYPLFINGRPGSGKSTILHYLFARSLHGFFSLQDQGELSKPPIYVTYSEPLLRAAEDSVLTILRCNSNLQIEGTKDHTISELAAGCFRVFHVFLLDLLPGGKDRARFAPKKRIDFTWFRPVWTRYANRNPDSEIRRLSPELVWHVIRTYTKGMSDEQGEPLTPDRYEELPEKNRSVTPKTYRTVFDKAWSQWYRGLCEEEGYWDDQDLILEVLRRDPKDLAQYPAVFCDEAQDFTKIELQLIIGLSLFSKRELSGFELTKVPFAFAGDPFQTLNPTGFDWGSVQAGFHERIVQELDRARSHNLKFNYRELTFNYRSTRHVVGICNLIQLVRGLLFDKKGLRPQTTWFDKDDAPPVVFFDVCDPICEKNLIEQSEAVILLPCQEGEEELYVESDDVLARIAGQDENPRNFLSAIAAKGLEFERIVIYKFGEHAIKEYPKLFEWLDALPETQANPEASLPLEYYMNRLYVAASRAKKRVIVVDTREGISQLWANSRLSSFDSLIRLYPKASELGWADETLSYAQPGMEDSWRENRDDPLKIAENIKLNGIRRRDAYSLKIAAANFKRADRKADAIHCEALRAEFDGSFNVAAQKYQELSRGDDALRCFWLAGDFRSIVENSVSVGDWRHRVADFMGAPNDPRILMRTLLTDIPSQGGSGGEGWSDDTWTTVLEKTVESLARLEQLVASDFDSLQDLEKFGNPVEPSNDLARIALKSGHDEKALQILKEIRNPERDLLLVAESRALPYPANLPSLSEVNPMGVIEEWKNHPEVELGEKHREILTKCLEKSGDVALLVEYLKTFPDIEKLKKILRNRPSELPSDALKRAGIQLMQTVLNERGWQSGIRLLENGTIPGEIKEDLCRVMVTEIATSEGLPRAHNRDRKAVATFLRKELFTSPKLMNCSIGLVGAAVEKANRLIDAIDFYQAVGVRGRYNASDEEKRFARIRLAKVKAKYAAYLADNREKTREADTIRKEALALAADLGVRVEDLPEYPPASVRKSTVPPPAEALLDGEQRSAARVLLGQGWEKNRVASMFNVSTEEIASVPGQTIPTVLLNGQSLGPEEALRTPQGDLREKYGATRSGNQQDGGAGLVFCGSSGPSQATRRPVTC